MRTGRRHAARRFSPRTLLPGLLLALATAAILIGPDLPPPRLLFRYGLPPAGGPTDRTVVLDRIEFAEIAPGYARVRRRVFAQKGDFLGSLCRPLGLPFGVPDVPAPYGFDAWVEAPRTFWIGRAVVDAEDRGRLPGYLPDGSEWTAGAEDLVWFAVATGGLRPAHDDVRVASGRPRGSVPLLVGRGWDGRALTSLEIMSLQYSILNAQWTELMAQFEGDPNSADPEVVIRVWVPPE